VIGEAAVFFGLEPSAASAEKRSLVLVQAVSLSGARILHPAACEVHRQRH
jgi:hypothetical protein